VDQPKNIQKFYHFINKTPKKLMIGIYLFLLFKEPKQEETFCFPKEGIKDPIRKPLDEGFFIFFYFEETKTLPHWVTKAGCND